MAYSSADPEEVKQIQEEFGTEVSSDALETFFGETAKTAGGSGDCPSVDRWRGDLWCSSGSLRFSTLEIGPEIDPGVPALRASDDLVIALKSGNFGGTGLFAKAAKVLGEDG